MNHSMMSAKPTEPVKWALTRSVGRWSLLALTVNCVVGAGILGLPGQVFARAGEAIPWVVMGAAALATSAALCLAELGSRFDGTGGPVEYCRSAFGSAAGFATGWLLWTATVLAAAALLNLLAGLIAPGHWLATIVLAGAALTLLAMAGMSRSAAASAGLTVVKILLLAAFVVAAFASPAGPALPPATPAAPATAVVLLFFAFVGFERTTAVAGEVIDPRRAMPFALIAGMAIVSLLYAGIFAACLRGLPDLASSDQPLREMAVRLFGKAVAGALSWAAAVIVLGTLITQWITAPRLMLALAREGQMPVILARVSTRRHTPDLAIILTGATAVLLALTGDFVATVTASSASRLLIFIGCAASLLRLRARPDAPVARFRLPGGAVLGVSVIVACGLLLAFAAAELTRVAAILLFGVLLWLMTRRT